MDKDITIVTSFGPSGYDQYGRNFLRTFRRHWPNGVRLVAYHEGTQLPTWCESVNLMEVGPCAKFLYAHADNEEAHGTKQAAGRSWKRAAIEEGYNFRFDAYKFCRKVFAVWHASRLVKSGKLFWLDADVVTFADVDWSLFDEVLPEDADISYLARWKGYHSECGFVGYNLDSRRVHRFLDKFAGLYDSGEVFRLGEWHDSYVFDQVREMMDVREHKIPTKTMNRVFDTSPLGKYMKHLKGKLKENAA